MTEKFTTAKIHEKKMLSIKDKDAYSQNKVTIELMVQPNVLGKRLRINYFSSHKIVDHVLSYKADQLVKSVPPGFTPSIQFLEYLFWKLQNCTANFVPQNLDHQH